MWHLVQNFAKRSSWCQEPQGLAGPTLGCPSCPGWGGGLWDLRAQCARRGAGPRATLGPPAWDALRDTQSLPARPASASFLDSQNAVLILKNSAC